MNVQKYKLFVVKSDWKNPTIIGNKYCVTIGEQYIVFIVLLDLEKFIILLRRVIVPFIDHVYFKVIYKIDKIGNCFLHKT